MATNQTHSNKLIECIDVPSSDKDGNRIELEHCFIPITPNTPAVQTKKEQNMFSPSRIEMEKITLSPGSPPAKEMSRGALVGTQDPLELFYIPLNPNPALQTQKEYQMFSPSPIEIERVPLSPGSPPAKGMSRGSLVGTQDPLEYLYTPLKPNTHGEFKNGDQKPFFPSSFKMRRLLGGLSPEILPSQEESIPMEYNWSPIPLESRISDAHTERDRNKFFPASFEMRRLLDSVMDKEIPGNTNESVEK